MLCPDTNWPVTVTSLSLWVWLGFLIGKKEAVI